MKIKKIYKSILVTSIIVLSSCVSQTNDKKVEAMIEAGNQAEFQKSYSDPMEYNDALVGLQMRYTILALAIEEYQGNSIEDIKELNNNLQLECSKILSILDDISFELGNDYGLKSSLKEIVELYQCCYINEREMELLEAVLLMEDLDTTDINAIIEAENIIEEYTSVVESQSEILQQPHLLFSKAQENFSDYYNLLIEDKNPLDERIDALEE